MVRELKNITLKLTTLSLSCKRQVTLNVVFLGKNDFSSKSPTASATMVFQELRRKQTNQRSTG